MPHRACAFLSQDEVIGLARSRLGDEVDYFVRHFGESAHDVMAGRFVQFSDFGMHQPIRFSVTYETPREQLLIMNITKACAIDFGYTHRIMTPMNAVFSRDLRISDPAVGR